jgi:hypothetical protein
MKQKFMLRSLALSLLCATPLSAIDFTPVLSVKKLEKFNVPVLTFNAGGRRISYKPPFKWQSVGTTEALTLTPSDLQGATMKFSTLRWSAEQSAKLKTPESERNWALEHLPQGASEVSLTAMNESPFMLGTHSSREWVFKYRLDGILYATSVSRCDVSLQERILILISSPAKDFESFRQDGISSLFSWEWL